MVKGCLSRMSGKLSHTILRRGKGSNPFSLVDYASYTYRYFLLQHHVRQSISRRGNLYDNATAKNFFNCLKCEFAHFKHFHTRVAAETAIFWYIAVLIASRHLQWHAKFQQHRPKHPPPYCNYSVILFNIRANYHQH